MTQVTTHPQHSGLETGLAAHAELAQWAVFENVPAGPASGRWNLGCTQASVWGSQQKPQDAALGGGGV